MTELKFRRIMTQILFFGGRICRVVFDVTDITLSAKRQ